MKEKPKFYVVYKDFNTGDLVRFDVLSRLWDDLLTKSNKIKSTATIYDELLKRHKKIETKSDLAEYIQGHLMYHYWSKCEWEFIIVDWPFKQDGLIENARPKKIDAYYQAILNIDVIVDLVWDFIKNK